MREEICRVRKSRSRRAPYIQLDACEQARARLRMMLLPLLLAVHAAEDDTGLVARLQRRDPQALGELYDRYGRLTFSLILRVVRDAGIAEDLVQETFLRVWNRVHGFDAQKGSIGPWLLAVARNRAIDYLRSAGGRERNALEFEETDHPGAVLRYGTGHSEFRQRPPGEVRGGEAFAEPAPGDRTGVLRRTVANRDGRTNGPAAGNGEDLGAHGAEESARRTRRGGAGMNCEELRDYYELYAMGVADEPERSEIREHLNRGCEVCMHGMKRAREMWPCWGRTAPAAAPSALRRRILARVGVEQRRFGWAPFLAVAIRAGALRRGLLRRTGARLGQ